MRLLPAVNQACHKKRERNRENVSERKKKIFLPFISMQTNERNYFINVLPLLLELEDYCKNYDPSCLVQYKDDYLTMLILKLSSIY